MRAQVEARLKELRAEFESGQVRLRELELETARLREAVLRISGAIQVLQELLAGDDAPAGDRQPIAKEQSPVIDG